MITTLKTAAAVATALSLAAPASAACLNFNQHIPNGSFGGGIFQLDANTKILIKPTVFWASPPPTPTFSGLTMDSSTCFGGPDALHFNNTSATFQIIQQEQNAKVIHFNYCDLGGHENVGADGSTPPQFIGEITNVPPTLSDPFGGQVRVAVSENPIPGGKEGKLIFEATSDPVILMEVGGQEFAGHSICIN